MTIDARGAHHRPPGSPASTGGQYAQKPTPNAAGALVTPEAPWQPTYAERPWIAESDVPTRHSAGHPEVGYRSPWGVIDNVSRIAPGMHSVTTVGHGGVHLSPERNKLVPAAVRERSGWYNEDDLHPIVRTFPEAFASRRGRDDIEAVFADADQALRDRQPNEWERVTGQVLEPGQSRGRDRQVFEAQHGGGFRVGTHARAVDGFVTVVGTRDGERELLRIPEEVYEQLEADRRQASALGGYAGAQYVVPTPKAPTFAERIYPIDRAAIPAAAQPAAAKLWRADGRIMPLLDIVEERGVAGRIVMADGLRMSFYVRHPDGSLTGVPKVLWEALPGEEEGLEDSQERVELRKLELEAERLRGSNDFKAVQEGRARMAALLHKRRDEQEASNEAYRRRVARRDRLTTTETFYDDYQAAIDEAAPWTSDGVASPDLPAETRERIQLLAEWGREQRLIA